MGKYINICNVYVFLWCIFRLKGWLYQGDQISTISYIIIMLISLYYAIICYKDYRYQPVIKYYNILIVFFSIYGIINILFFEDLNKIGHVIPTDFFLQNILRSMLPFYAFYAFTKKGYITQKWLCYVAIIVLFISVPRYFIEQRKMMQLMLAKGLLNVDEVTNNAGYLFSALLPLFCFWNKKPLVQYAGFLICIFFMLSGMKRGAILVGGLSLFFIFFSVFRTSNTKSKIVFLILTIICIFLSYKYFSYMEDSSAYFMQRLEDTKEGNTSSRFVLYEDFWNMFWNNSNPFSLLFGLGADATIRYGKNYAHNDWLEIAVDHGMIGITVFFVFWKRMLHFWRTTRKYPVIYVALGACVIQLFAKTFFSMSINDMEFYTVLVLGYCVAIVTKPQLIVKQEIKQKY